MPFNQDDPQNSLREMCWTTPLLRSHHITKQCKQYFLMTD